MKTLLLWALLAFFVGADARTAQNQSPITAQITSLTDKDARRKASVHPAFANAGRQAGVEVWRIVDFNPVAVPQSDVGKFNKGDSYIVLKTTADKKNNLSWDIYYWIGSQSTQDESGAAAILTVGLDDKFGGAAVQHRETLGHESQPFLSLFRPAIRYVDGGAASGFNHVVTNPGAEKRMFNVKGKKNIRIRQVEPQIASMNKGDCFILDVNNDIFVYVGDSANHKERLKAISFANQIRDQDHNGRGRVDIVDQYSSDTDLQRFFTSLGSGARDLVTEASAGGDDQAFERSEENAVSLTEISDSTGSLVATPLRKPLRQEQLKPQDTYILDTVSGSIYVWIGKQSSKREKSEAMSKAQQLLSSKNYPSWKVWMDCVKDDMCKKSVNSDTTAGRGREVHTVPTPHSWEKRGRREVQVTRIPQGTEPAAFKQYFATWRDVGMSHTRLVRSLKTEIGAAVVPTSTVSGNRYLQSKHLKQLEEAKIGLGKPQANK